MRMPEIEPSIPEEPIPVEVAELRHRVFTPRRIAMQAIGVLVGMGLLVWVGSMVLSPENRERLRALEAPPAPWVCALLVASVLSVVINGTVFWAAALPIRRLRLRDVVGVNALATMLSPLPFKLGFLSRAIIHMRRDGMHLRELVPWFAGVAAVTLCVIVPVGVAGIWRREVDAVWLLIVAAGPPACAGLGIFASRLAATRPWLAKLSLGSWRVARHPGIVYAQVALRFADLTMQSVRFYAAARVAGVPLDVSHAALLGTSYLLLTAIAPAGTLGFAEMGTAGIATLAGSDTATVGLIALVVTISQFSAATVLSAIAGTWLRPFRVLFSGRRPPHT